MRRQNAQRRRVFGGFALETRRQFQRRDAHLRRALDNLVLDIGHVLDVRDFEAARFEHAAQHVVGHESARVPDMQRVVRRHAANIERDFARLARRQLFFLARQRVEEKNSSGRHSLSV